MMKSVEGIYRDGKVELLELLDDVTEAKVIVTFIDVNDRVDLRARGIHEQQAADLRSRLGAFVEDWDRPDMDAYDAL